MTRWHRLWTIWLLTRNLEVVIHALRMRHVTTVYEFVISGGHLRPMGLHTRIEWKGMEFEMLSHQLWALASLKSMAEHGWLLTRLDTDRYLVALPSGDTFIVYRDTMASDLMVLHERFIEDEYGRVDVSNHLVLDIGANIGDSAIYFARMGAEVHAFEPFRQLYQRLSGNVERNHLGQQIYCHQIGIGVCSGTTKGIYNRQESLSSAVSSTVSDNLHDIPSELETVQLVSLSEALTIARLSQAS
ncbi:MAG: hypothetical protein C7B46_11325 [Sulfobacillus benefaciens]|uniref:Methyltransferase FkbM domain-containing protein n=1 Tax=Sulfobacillus benefaciens TaxID=453960 RepID=A0A2T2XF74_9FIRM|nr:MAG: hypothetical protein C7B46_11325 [Sulfobacillus benefaciens]